MTTTNNEAHARTIDWHGLREEGLKHLQAMSGHIWTDYGVHDPGVTILELLCHAIIDLNNRLAQNIGDILAAGRTDTGDKQFFTPREILTVNPVTINDYRKLLIDLPGVKNAWLFPVDESSPALYYDQDNDALVYDYVPGAQKVNLKGLYRVFIEKDEDVTDEEELKKAVIERLHAHRNLCEDFAEVQIMAEETVSIFSDIEIAEEADPDEVMGKIYYDLANFISPRVKQYSLKRMLEKGKTIEEIFTGPPLENGFIDDDELGTGEKRKELHASDLIRIIMAHPEVKDVRNLYMSNKLNPEMRDKQEWALVVDDTKALVLEPFNGNRLRIFKNDKLCLVRPDVVKAVVARLKKEHSREIFDDPAMDLPEVLSERRPGQETSGEPASTRDYSPLTYKLPAAYGVGETGLPSTASPERRVQAKQLRAYLLFFEQLLVNYLKQLESFKRLFAFRQNRAEILKSYFTQLLPEELWKDDFPEIEKMITEDPTEKLPFSETAFSRKNRILDHLLAQFNEKFSDFAFFGFKYSKEEGIQQNQKEREYLKAKADFLENYPQLSRDRNRACNYLTLEDSSGQVDGLKRLIAAKLGIDLHPGTPGDPDSEEFYLVEHILFRPDASMPLDFVCTEKISAGFQPDPYSHRLTFVLPRNAGRFSNSRFKELVYTTIANETPAHISYNVVEMNAGEMQAFIETYNNFLRELVRRRQGLSADYNLYRNALMEMLEIGRPGLPVLHLDASDVSAGGHSPEDGSPVLAWKDLSLNNHHALAETEETAPKYLQPVPDAPAYLRFSGTSRLKIGHPLVRNDFSIVAVFKAQPGAAGEEYFKIITGTDQAGTGDYFSLGFTGDGRIKAGVSGETIALESEAGSPHLAVFTRDHKTGEVRLFLDGVLQTAALKETGALNPDTVIIGPGADCDLGEIIVFDSVLTGRRREKLEAFLGQKWGIPLSAVSSIAKPALHLAADAGVVRDETTNALVSWHDLSQGEKVITPRDGTKPPVYEGEGIGVQPAVSFAAGHGAALVIPNAAGDLFQEDFTLCFVYQTQEGGGCLLDGRAAPENGEEGFFIGLDRFGGFEVRGKAEGVKLASTLNEPHLAIVTGRVLADRLAVTIWLDGKFHAEEEFTDTRIFKNSPADLLIGQSQTGDRGFVGKIGEIVIYDEALSAWDRQRLEKFMAGRWQIDISGVEPVAPPVLHLDAARLETVLDETGAPAGTGARIYQWLDLGSSANHGVQEAESRRPEYVREGINGLPAIRFTQEKADEDDFYEDCLNVDRVIQDDFTMMVVFKADPQYYPEEKIPAVIESDTPWTEGVAIIDADCSGRYNDFGLSFGKRGEKMIVMAGIGDRVTQDHTIKSRELDFNRAHFLTFTREKTSGEVKLYANGLLQAQADLRDDVTLNDARTIRIGAFNSEGRPFHGLVGEVILFDQVLTEEQRQRIENYLSGKWGIPRATLPVDAAGILFHLDAAVAASIIKDDEGRVEQWADLDNLSDLTAVYPEAEAHGETEVPPVYVAQGIFGQPAVEFNNSFLTIAPEMEGVQDFTLALVYEAFNAGNIADDWDEAGLVDHYALGGNDFGLTVTKNNTLRLRLGAQRIETPAALNAPHIVVITRDQAEARARIYLDGLLVATAACDPQTTLGGIKELTIGAIRKLPGEEVSKGYFCGNLGELFMFSRVLSERERQDVEEYLSLKWRIDLSGVNRIAKPVLHLDAGRLSTVVVDDAGRVSRWLDLNGGAKNASQAVPDRRPLYRQNAYNELGVLGFDGKQTCLTVKPVVHEDFTIIIVYRAEPGTSSAYMPVAPDSFTLIPGVESELSIAIWTQIKDLGYIDENGKVLPKFTPGKDGFTLGLEPALLEALHTVLTINITAVLTEHSEKEKRLMPEALTGAVGEDQELAQTVWLHLHEENYLTEDGRVLKTGYLPENGEFLDFLAETAVINVLLAEDWPAGAGIFDGNCPGDRGQPNKRDFGILHGEDGRLIAVIGVPDEGDYLVEQDASFDQLHIAALTREKATGMTRLYVDNRKPVEKRIAQNITLKDSKRFTIGAVNTGGNHFTGEIAEIIVLDRVLTAQELAVVRDFLARKWGISL